MSPFVGKRIYITGGASGIGLETGRQLAALGAHIVVLDYAPTDAAQRSLEAACVSTTQTVARYQFDIAKRQQVLDTVARAVTDVGPPDIMINSAGIGVTGEFVAMKFEDFDRVMQVNLYGTRHICEAVVPVMLKRGGGKIALIASMGGIVPVYGYTDYGTSKFAVVGFGECLRIELKPRGIDVVLICPGEVETPMVEAERKVIHPATRALKDTTGTISATQAARDIVRGLVRNRPLIVTGGLSRVVFWLRRLLPPSLWNSFIDHTVARALRHGPDDEPR
jgi:3-dehydrosphinganine reductase